MRPRARLRRLRRTRGRRRGSRSAGAPRPSTRAPARRSRRGRSRGLRGAHGARRRGQRRRRSAHADLHLHERDGSGAKHPLGAPQHLEIEALGVDLQQVDPLDALLGCEPVDGDDLDRLVPAPHLPLHRSQERVLHVVLVERDGHLAGLGAEGELDAPHARPVSRDPHELVVGLGERLERPDVRVRERIGVLECALPDVRPDVEHRLDAEARHLPCQVEREVDSPRQLLEAVDAGGQRPFRQAPRRLLGSHRSRAYRRPRPFSGRDHWLHWVDPNLRETALLELLPRLGGGAAHSSREQGATPVSMRGSRPTRAPLPDDASGSALTVSAYPRRARDPRQAPRRPSGRPTRKELPMTDTSAPLPLPGRGEIFSSPTAKGCLGGDPYPPRRRAARRAV